MKALLLSIKPEYVDRILQETKKYEYRKKLAKRDVHYIYIYCTAPQKEVVASVQITERLSAPPNKLWKMTKSASGISYDAYKKYFYGCQTAYAYKLGNINVFKSPKTLSDFGLEFPPQSFVYIDI